MKVILVFVSTLDGKITEWGNSHVRKWTSKEDQEYYKQIWKNERLIVMGSNTYMAEKFSPSPHLLLLVMTKHISKYKEYEVPGQIEFIDTEPKDLVEQYQKKGFEKMMVVGGPHVATSFFEEQLIDELWLTIEPKIFGKGGNFVSEQKLDIDLTMIKCEKVNEKGTMIARYAVIKK
ncbi:MAG: dihydrofolate reductase family protein [Ginsengibacter sp.]|jgi:dihydrofolate reductase